MLGSLLPWARTAAQLVRAGHSALLHLPRGQAAPPSQSRCEEAMTPMWSSSGNMDAQE